MRSCSRDKYISIIKAEKAGQFVTEDATIIVR